MNIPIEENFVADTLIARNATDFHFIQYYGIGWGVKFVGPFLSPGCSMWKANYLVDQMDPVYQVGGR